MACLFLPSSAPFSLQATWLSNFFPSQKCIHINLWIWSTLLWLCSKLIAKQFISPLKPSLVRLTRVSKHGALLSYHNSVVNSILSGRGTNAGFLLQPGSSILSCPIRPWTWVHPSPIYISASWWGLTLYQHHMTLTAVAQTSDPHAPAPLPWTVSSCFRLQNMIFHHCSGPLHLQVGAHGFSYFESPDRQILASDGPIRTRLINQL